MKVTVKTFLDDSNGDRQLILRKKRKFYKTKGLEKSEARRLIPIIPGGASCTCNTINATQERYLLMGKRQGDKLVIQFGMVWKKKDKEFRKGVRAIRKSSKCEGIFRELSAAGLDKNGNSKSDSGKEGGKRGGKKRRKGHKRRKGKGKGKGKGKKGRKSRKRKDRKGRKNGKRNRKDRKRKGNKKGNKGRSSTTKLTSTPDQAMVSKWQAEDQALNNFKKLDN